jgi:hypothetical protein
MSTLRPDSNTSTPVLFAERRWENWREFALQNRPKTHETPPIHSKITRKDQSGKMEFDK